MPQGNVKQKQNLTEYDLKAIVDAEIEWSMGYVGGELSGERQTAMDYYLGNPYGDEVDGRSQVVTSEVADTIEWILPDLLRVFTTTDEAVEFQPMEENDEEAAKQESDAVNYVFYKENKGWLSFYTWFKDALLQKNGILKCYWEETEKEEREEYKGLTDDEMVMLLEDPELKVIESSDPYLININGIPTEATDIVCIRTSVEGITRVIPVPPEEFLISRDAYNCYPESARFCAHRVRKTATQLIEEGYDPKIVDTIPSDEGYSYNDERITRRHLEDETPDTEVSTMDRSMRTFWITECYLKVDYDNDGIAELRKVTRAGDHLLDNEPVDRIPFHSVTPVILTHKFFGLSISDLVEEIQKIKSTILRSVLDNFYITNNREKVVNERVNLSDLLTSRPGGIKRVSGETEVQSAIMELNINPIGADGYALMEYMDKIKRDRTGVDENTQGMSPDVLARINNGVLAASTEAAKQRIALIARIFAETGVKSLFLHIHELMQKHQTKAKWMRIRGKWAEINPSEWRKRENMTVNVGLGTGSREQQMMGAGQLLEIQQKVVENGGMGVLTTPSRIYNGLEKFVESMGFKSAETFFLDPESKEAQQLKQQKGPPKPDPSQQAIEATLKIEMGKIQQKNQADQQKAQNEMRKLIQNNLQFQQEQSLKTEQMLRENTAKMTELELKFDQNVPGSVV